MATAENMKVIGFTANLEVVDAVKAAAKREMISMSDVLRRAVVRELMQSGFLKETA